MATVSSASPTTAAATAYESNPSANSSDPKPAEESSASQVKDEPGNTNSKMENEEMAEVIETTAEEAENVKVRVNPREEWIDKERPTFCKVCDFQAQSTESYQMHNITVRHVRKVIEVFNIKLPSKEEKKEVKKEQNPFHCQVCLISCNSESAWNSHLVGQKHRKILEKQGAEKAQQKLNAKAAVSSYGYQFGGGSGMRGGMRGGMKGSMGGGPLRGAHHGPGHRQKPYEKPAHSVQQPSNSGSGPIGAMDFAQYHEPLIGLEYVTEIQVVGQSPRYHCELCDSKFDHNLKFPHLVGAKHRFNVLKEKVPRAAQEIRVGIKKRSELTAKLLDEAMKLENTEGRKQVKTRIEKSPYSKVNAMGNQSGAALGTASYTGQIQRGRGGGAVRGNRGGGQVRGNAASRGSSARGGTGRGGMNNQSNRGGRGRGGNQFTGRGGRGRGQGKQGQGQGQNWQQQHATPSTANQPFPSSGGYPSTSSYDSGEHLLPKEALRPRSPPRSTTAGPYYSSFDNTDLNYDSYYGNDYNYTKDRYGGYTPYNNRYDQQQVQGPPVSQIQGSSTGSAAGTEKMIGNLKGALGDLSKLVSSEEDASMALQVSNALTQALLTFRMQNIEGANPAGVGENPIAQPAGNPGGPK